MLNAVLVIDYLEFKYFSHRCIHTYKHIEALNK